MSSAPAFIRSVTRNSFARTVSAMASGATQLSGPAVLFFFCAIQFLTYFDRGTMSGLLPYVQKNFQLTGVEGGLLGSGYFISVMIVAPLVAGALVRASGIAQMYGIAGGSLVWAVAMLTCAVAPDYWVLLLGRVLSGLGEAFYCVLASPIIDDAAPAGWKALYLGVFYALVFVATGVGFVLPGMFPDWDSGRVIFVGEALLMAPVVLVGFWYAGRFHKPSGTVGPHQSLERQMPDSFANELSSSFIVAVASLNSAGPPRAPVPAWKQTVDVLVEPRYFLFFLGYGASVFTLNGFNFWGPTYIEEDLNTSRTESTLLLGAAVIVSGLAGTGLGGIILDRMTEKMPEGADASGERCRAAARLSAASMLLSLPVGCVAASCTDVYSFVGFTGIYLFLASIPTAPVIVGMMEAVPASRRGIAMGLASFGSHIFGDVLSPVVVGALKDKTGSLLAGVWLLVIWSIWPVVFFALAGRRRSAA